jgi:hypothetical protein
MSRAREVSKVTATVASLSASVADFDAVAYSSASPSGAQTGDLWVDTSTANPLIKAYDGTIWDTLGSAPVPIITGIAPDNIAGTASTAVIINGSNFESGSIVKLIDTNNTELFTLSTTFNNSRSLQFLTPALTASAGPYDVKVTNPDNQISILENALSVGSTPIWSTDAGSLGLIYDSARSSTTFSLLATDADSQNVTYELVSGSFPTGMSMTSGGVISGTTSSVASDTTYAFTIRAKDTSNNFIDRSFNITTKAPIIQSFTTIGNTSWTCPLTGSIQVLVVGGGGGGAGAFSGGGGGGGVVYSSSYPVTPGAYSISVGSGGLGGLGWMNGISMRGTNGGDSVFGPLTAKGGGGGGQFSNTSSYAPLAPALTGGSGGGGGSRDSSTDGFGTNLGAASNQTSFGNALSYGNAGGNGAGGGYTAGGGGGAGAPGANGDGTKPGNGGNGIQISITGSSVYYAGGGGGGSQGTGFGTGGLGGGGNGSAQTPNVDQLNGTSNTGGGGGGAGYNAGTNSRVGGNGGSGIVIIKY